MFSKGESPKFAGQRGVVTSGQNWNLDGCLGDNTCNCGPPIFLLKASYGGRNLAIDFRPPTGAGMGNYSASSQFSMVGSIVP
mmetsp:Transcript_2509/g.3986  ORF Transcript_2509/g.3986 Transcript_2509/m.3986 type:complete len:82 (-) Transcript_2509:37-282(-)